jgi:hypothetical protein
MVTGPDALPIVPESSPLDCNTIAPAANQVVAFGNVQVRG